MILALLALGCRPDDVTRDPLPDTGSTGGDDSGITGDDTADTEDPGDTTDGGADPSIVGAWISEGEDLAPLFAEYTDITQITADFRANGTYEVVSTSPSEGQVTFTGTYTVGHLDSAPHAIALEQDAPDPAASEGIWQVQGDVLKYEVVVTPNSYGFVAPTPEGGFGSTSGPGLEPGDNLQIYRAL